MKKIFNILGVVLMCALALTGCTPDDYADVNPKGIPSMEGVEAVIEVDQETNNVTFSLPSTLKGVMPVWIFDGKTYSTVNGLRKLYASAGDYTVDLKLMNKNGISDGSKTFSFHVNNTIFDFSKVHTFFAGGAEGSTKEWRMDNEAVAHMGCGEPGSDGTNWWAAQPNDKAGVGIYENRIIFSSDDKYTFDPGTSGTMYVNNGVKGLWPEYEATDDYCVPAELTTADIKWEVVGEDLYMILPEHTPFLYIPNTDFWAAPRFKVANYSPSTITLISAFDGIVWTYTLTSGAAKQEFNGYKYEHEANIWRTIDENASYTTSFWYAPGWNQIADPEFKQEGNAYTYKLPSATTDQWQAQCFIIPNELNLSSAINYDFSCIINSNKDHNGVTLKLTDKSSDGNFLFTERVKVKAYEPYVFYLTDLPGIDADCKLVLDFGGNAEDSEITISRITLKDHAVDDGTVLPSDEEEDGSVTWREEDNILSGVQGTDFFWYAPGWNQIADPEKTAATNGFTLKFPDATTDQWQAQYHIKSTGISLSAEKKYDFRVKILSNQAHPGVTLKLCENDDDNVFILNERPSVKAYEETVLEYTNLDGADIANLKVVFDFGGNGAGAEITVSDMLLQEHIAGANEMTWNADSENNMWQASFAPNHFWYAPGWNQIADPACKQDGRKVTLTFPQATTDQWQAQVAYKTELSTSASEKYDFQVILTPNADIKGVTIKLVQDGDDNNFYFADRHDLKAYEPFTYRMPAMAGIDMEKVNLFFDFGGNPANAEVEISDIILRKNGTE